MKSEQSEIQREWDEYKSEQSRALEICDNCGHTMACHGDWTGECFRCTCQQFTKDTAAMPNIGAEPSGPAATNERK